MDIQDKRIDGGKAFDWSKVSKDYAKYRDIYPVELYQRLLHDGLCTKGQTVLDIGTGTGVLPRNMYAYGANFIGTDIAEGQIQEAISLSKLAKMHIRYEVMAAEQLSFSSNSFDIITACQCFFYFDYEIVVPRLANMLKEKGKLAIMYMAWLPFEDEIAEKSEELILAYNPRWSGAKETRKEIDLPPILYDYFDVLTSEVSDCMIPFTQESWHGRMKACRGMGASLSPQEIVNWEKEHMRMLHRYPESFEVKHYLALTILQVKKESL